MIVIRDMTFRIAGRVLFDEASATIPDGHKVGLVGRNGTGKSTLLKLLTEEYQADSGSKRLRGGGGQGRHRHGRPGSARRRRHAA